MNKRYRLFAIAFLFCFCLFGNLFLAKAQVDTGDVIAPDEEEEFSMDGFEEADDTVIKKYCNNKINNLNPTTLIGLSYDFMFGSELESINPDDSDSTFSYKSPISLNHGIRLDANIPLVSKSNIIFNATFSYWESRYNFDQVDTRDALALSLNNNPLRTATLGILAFKPLDEKHFLIFQAATSLNGNYSIGTYDAGEVEPDFGKMKYTASLLYGWKKSDNQNLAIGVTRTYRGGKLLHVPIFMWNKTFNNKWGMELLLPARGSLRYNFSAKSSLNFGYELEGQSYLLQNSPNNDIFATNNYELSKSEIRGRIELNKALSSFIRLNLQAGVAPAYRFDLANGASNDANEVSIGSLGLPMYFRIGLNFVSP
ncbi:DUF6268 family outer membrane beta-barrel protein [Bernardetia sp. Wsw4-3y2]|uniref:DUF6268 family outer membrane beta-barrel protein n=1 Tax=Bernardetia sp. Wsw4-3y2 TaxID=3127471 RepID=UPI0030CCC474